MSITSKALGLGKIILGAIVVLAIFGLAPIVSYIWYVEPSTPMPETNRHLSIVGWIWLTQIQLSLLIIILWWNNHNMISHLESKPQTEEEWAKKVSGDVETRISSKIKDTRDHIDKQFSSLIKELQPVLEVAKDIQSFDRKSGEAHEPINNKESSPDDTEDDSTREPVTVEMQENIQEAEVVNIDIEIEGELKAQDKAIALPPSEDKSK